MTGIIIFMCGMLFWDTNIFQSRYTKKSNVGINTLSKEMIYEIWIYENGIPFKRFELQKEKVNKTNVDSLNTVVDSIIIDLEKFKEKLRMFEKTKAK